MSKYVTEKELADIRAYVETCGENSVAVQYCRRLLEEVDRVTAAMRRAHKLIIELNSDSRAKKCPTN